ncbi:MAG: hypothetical protein L0H53_09405 [Candidatus Nitrosocosmicus sp.]|nr:hypothetical protein [Candidatus Nitrosocosmicus sp.]MDN5867665.1 hypothetical protein [Candidatus Nitrosocosmicus sp.]
MIKEIHLPNFVIYFCLSITVDDNTGAQSKKHHELRDIKLLTKSVDK